MNKTWLGWAAAAAMFLAPAAMAGSNYSLSYTVGGDYGYTTVGYDRYGYNRGYRYNHYRRPARSYSYVYRPYSYYDYRPYVYSYRPYAYYDYRPYRYSSYRHDYRHRGRHYRRYR